MAKLLIGFVVVALLCGVTGVIGVSQLTTMGNDIKDMAGNTIPTLMALDRVEMDIRNADESVNAMTNPLAIGNDAFIAAQKNIIQAAKEDRAKAVDLYDSTHQEAQAQKLWDAFKAALPGLDAYNDSIIALVDKAGRLPSTAPVTTGTGAAARTTNASNPERDAIFAQLADKLVNDNTMENVLAANQKVQDFDRQFYTIDSPKAVEAGGAQAVVIVIIVTILALGAAIVIGLILGTSMSKSVRKVVESVGRIAVGDLSQKLDAQSKDELGVLARSVNTCIDNINSLVADAGMLAQAAVDGRLSTRADASKHLGDYRKIVDGVNKTLDAVINPINVTARYVDDISKGVIPPIITDTYNGDFNIIKNNLNAVVKMMSDLLKETDIIIKAATDGELDKRANASLFLGGWNQLVAGVNSTITAIVDPLMVTADYVDKVAKGVIPPEITTVYKGQYNLIKTNLNAVVKMMSELLKETDIITKAAADGELDKRANAGLFQGGWNQLVSGVNSTITAIVDPLMVTADYVDKVAKGVIPPEITTVYKGQYNLIKTNLNAVVKMMSELLKETDFIVKAAADGELDKRADAGKFLGGWNQLVAGVNSTITAIVDPLMVTADYIDKVTKGVIPPEITTVYKGQYNLIKTNLNAVVKMMSELLRETDIIIKAASDGELDKRANANLFQGGWKQLVSGVNDTITNIVDPLMVTADYVDKVAKGVIPPEITTVYKGQYNLIKTNLNAVVKMMSELLSETDKLVKAAIAGQLDTRADAGKFLGGWNQLVKGVNETLAEVITPINETVAVLKRLADGDLTLRMAGEYKGDFDILKTALNDSLEAFNDTLRQVNIAVDQVAEGSLQVSQASQSLSQGATEQASSLEEITSSITEISSQTKLNTESAVTVNDLAKTAKNNAEQGNLQMQNLVAAMADINKSAEEIKKIVKAIDDISFQINLLALNANVEAARAGKYGKGFAVVAEEVRNLAVRSANSVKDTTRMVDDTISNIERGNSLCDLTAKQLADIVGGAGQVATLAEEVATASKEQTQGLEQVSTGLNQIDQVTQANTASSEESASASEELSSQSQQVKSMLSRFKLKSKEGKVDNSEMLQMLRAEMAKQGSGHRSGSPAAAIAQRPGPSNGRKAKVMAIDPSEVISLDDDNFGKF
jgi:methyl-accepting chemotaxis protein